MKYDTRTMTVFDDETVSLSTTESRVQCSLALPDADDGYQRQYLDSDEWSVTERCESEANADYNAAKNIGMRYVRRVQQSARRTGNSQLSLKSGTVTPSGGFTAHPDGFEADLTDKPHPQRAKSVD